MRINLDYLNRCITAHDYDEKFAETALKLLPQFIIDAKALSLAIAESQTDGKNSMLWMKL